MLPERIAIDLNNWKGKSREEISQDLASFPIESSNLTFEKRINVTALKLSDFTKLINLFSQSPEDLATVKINNWAQRIAPSIQIWTNNNHPSEKEILLEMKTLIDFNPGQLMVWISPAEKGVYEESRIGIYQEILVNNEKYLFFRSLCGNQYIDTCNHMAKVLARDSQEKIRSEELSDPQLLRSYPISIDVPGKSLLNYFRKTINMPAVWQTISKGEDIDRKIHSSTVVSTLLTDNVVTQIYETQLFNQQVRIGAWIEKELQERLKITLKSGSCGILYSNLAASPFIPFLGKQATFSSEGRPRKHCGKCGKTGVFTAGENCPYDQSSQN